MSFLSMIEEMPAFGEFDKVKNTPTIVFDLNQLVNTVGLLWENANKQRFVIEAMEREMAKRKTETEVRLRTMQNDLEGLVRNESKRREQEDDALRAEIERLRAHIDGGLSGLREEAKEQGEELQRSIDRASGVLRGKLIETETRVMDLSGDVDELRKAIEGLRPADGNSNIDSLLKAIDAKHGLICSFIGTTPENVMSAVGSHRSKEAFLKVPALADLANQIKSAESVANVALEEGHQTSKKILEVSKNVADLKTTVENVSKSVVESEARVTDGYTEGDKKLHKRIDDLAGRIGNISSPGVVQVQPSDSNEAIASLRDDLSEVAKRLRKVEREMEGKASVGDVVLKAALIDLDPIWEAINGLLGTVDSHAIDLAELKSRKAPSAEPVRKHIEPTPPRDDRLSEILARLGDAERMCKHLDDVKADKAEVNAALKDLMRRVEKALNALLARIQDLEALASPTEATAGRFRCLSCNRNAGPLQEQLAERMSSPQFPPSNVYVQNQRPHSASARPSQVAVPGMKDYGGGMTSSRKKLMNYYTWLQDRADSPSKSTQPERGERARSPSLRHPWPGAQSGNGEAGERQCGDKGSAEPEAIGSDGKYYVGVISRPQSATRRVDVHL